MIEQRRPWYRELTRYHWFVLLVAALGWMFDCLDQQLFILARPAAMKELVVEQATPELTALEIKKWGNYSTSIFLMGWATGGLFFGMLGDRIGRAKTMLITILMYSLFTGLSALSRGVWDFSFYRFLTGLGVGGEFAVGVALVAEVMPDKARPYTLALLQALSAVGNIAAALINLGLGVAEEEGLVSSPWRIMFVVGAVPALLAVVIRFWLKEPEKWQQASHDGAVTKRLGSYARLFEDPRWRKHALLGLVLACSGVIGLWGVGFFTPDLIREVQRQGVATGVFDEQLAHAQTAGNSQLAGQLEQIKQYELMPMSERQDLAPDLAEIKAGIEPVINGRLSRWASLTSILINIGAACGMFGFGIISQRIGRKPTFAIALVAAFVSTVSVFWFLKDISQMWMVPVMGFCQLSLFAGYAMYFPELFPTYLRSTGTSFCYNVGRFVAASGPLVQAQLIAFFAGLYGSSGADSTRLAGITMCSIFGLGLIVLPFLPETKDQPLPE
ncbi:MAG TPA: MFS transporter [Pirellulaceae bacterium]|nr:MFS transporter [Planctomycetales bacterium]HRX78429.1 MFS transporter [Pirellulaceae bacterium]